jgi:hypothetical protein
MAITMFDQWPFSLACGHTVVLGRLDKAETWTCETCGKITDLRVEPYRKELEDDRDTADQIDKQADSAAKPSSAPIQPTHRDLSRCCRRDPTPKVSVTARAPLGRAALAPAPKARAPRWRLRRLARQC